MDDLVYKLQYDMIMRFLMRVRCRSVIFVIILTLSGALTLTDASDPNSDSSVNLRHLRRKKFDPKTVSIKQPGEDGLKNETIQADSVIALVNTPGTGTEEIFSHVSNSLGCTLRDNQVDDVLVAPCADSKGVFVMKSHNQEALVATLGRITKDCLIITALRDPQVWIMSQFVAREQTYFCSKMTDKTADDWIQDYRAWIEKHIMSNRYKLHFDKPLFLKKYNTTLTEQMEVFETNNGYSLLPPLPVPEHLQALTKHPVEYTCSLLFVDFDELEKHPEAFNDVLPGQLYKSPEKEQACPENEERYKAIKSYQLTDDEIKKFIGDDSFSPYIEEWFKVFGYL